MTDTTKRRLLETLHSRGPAADRAEQMMLYGRFVGDWEMAATVYAEDGGTHTGQGEIHFGWALDGRAVQDVWILSDVFYGTTLRVYDPGLEAWHIIWSDPLRQYYSRQIGRPQGKEITQDGKDDSGALVRWRFTQITDDFFHWIGTRSVDDGQTWQLQAEFRASRVS